MKIVIIKNPWIDYLRQKNI